MERIAIVDCAPYREPYQWIEYSHGVAFWLQNLQLRAWKHKMVKNSNTNSNDDGGDVEPKGVDEQGDEERDDWIELASMASGAAIVKAIERVQYAMADDPPPELGEGSHILHVVLESDDESTTNDCSPQHPYSFEYPKAGYELCVILEEPWGDDNKNDDNTNIRTGRPPYLEANAHGILHVGVSATMAGSESEYLPDAYRPLYEDLSLRNPTYERFRERRRQQQKQPELLQNQDISTNSSGVGGSEL